MPRIPKRHPLPTQAAEIIRDLIANGELRGLLPGERTLASDLQIGRDTLRAALSLLETEGTISQGAHGKRRKILTRQRPKPDAVKRIIFLSPKTLVELPPWMMVEFDILRELLNARGYSLQLVSPKIFHLKNPARKLQGLLKDLDAGAWILYQCPFLIQTWFDQQKIPALIRGYPQPGILIPFLDEDWEAAAYHAGTLLKRKGHRRIGLLVPDSPLAGLKAAETGLRMAFPQSEFADAIVPTIEKGNAESVALSLGRMMRLKKPPTAVLVCRSRQTLSMISWMNQNKLCLPDDLSLVSLAYEPWYEHLNPKPSHYFSDPQSIARTVVKTVLHLAENQSPSPSQKLLIPEYIPGQTVASV